MTLGEADPASSRPDGDGSVTFRLWTPTTLAIAEASAGLHAEAATSLAGTIDAVVRLDSAAEYDAWLTAAARGARGPASGPRRALPRWHSTP